MRTWQQGRAAQDDETRRAPAIPPTEWPAPACHRRVAGQGAHDRRLPRQGLRGRVEHRPHPRHARQGRRDSGQVPQGAVGPARRERRPRLRAALRRQLPTRSSRSASSSSCSRTPTNCCSPLMRTARARRSPGTCWRSSSPRCPAQPDGVPRDHPRGDRAGRGQPARHRQRPRRGLPDPPGARPALRLRGLARCCGRRSCRSCRPAGSSRSRSGWWSTGSGSGSRSGRPQYWDLEAEFARSQRPPGRSDVDVVRRHAGRCRRPAGRAGPRLRPDRAAARPADAWQ